MNKAVLAFAILSVPASTAAWDAYSPSLAVSSLEKEWRAQDTAALTSHVDFDALRTNMKDALHARYALSAGGLPSSNEQPFTRVDRWVDATFTPAGVQMLMDGQAEEKAKGDIHARGVLASGDAAPQFTIHRLNWNHFDLTLASGQPFGLVFTREGFSWRITNLRLPADLAKAFARSPSRPAAGEPM